MGNVRFELCVGNARRCSSGQADGLAAAHTGGAYADISRGDRSDSWICGAAHRAHESGDRGIGKDIGTVTAKEGRYCLLILPDLSDLTPGTHGFHVHQNPDCGPGKEDAKKLAALAAGGHFDALKTGKHEGHPPAIVISAWGSVQAETRSFRKMLRFL